MAETKIKSINGREIYGVKSVNGIAPDDAGNVQVATGGGTITGTGAPTETTAGERGQLYMDSSSGIYYKCVLVVGDGRYIWEPLYNTSPDGGTVDAGGYLATYPSNYESIKNRGPCETPEQVWAPGCHQPITPATIDFAVQAVLTDSKVDWTAEQKEAAQRTLGVNKGNSVYDLKAGYAYTADVYIAEDGTETTKSGAYYKCVDYIPVVGGVSYTMYGVGYALYDLYKAFQTAFVDADGKNAIREFTPEKSGYVRLTINSDQLTFARFCLTDEKYKEWQSYQPASSPFYDPCIPCNVHVYGDSNSEGHGLEDKSKSWANRLGALITGMPSKVQAFRFTCYAEKLTQYYCPALMDTGYARYTAYTDAFYVDTYHPGEIAVKIDGEAVESITDSAEKTYSVPEGYHTIELFGVSGENYIQYIATNKKRTFANHAVFGNYCYALPATPEGNVVIVMFGTNDRMLDHGLFHDYIWTFYETCKTMGVTSYIFTPIPTAVIGEENELYKQSISDVIAQLPPDCINIYKDLQLIEVLTGETIFTDNVHLTERGHRLLYAIAASKLQLAALTSEIV